MASDGSFLDKKKNGTKKDHIHTQRKTKQQRFKVINVQLLINPYPEMKLLDMYFHKYQQLNITNMVGGPGYTVHFCLLRY